MWKKLKQIHSYNGWFIILLMITGIILYIPALRGPLAEFRVSIKNIHIGLGAFSVLLLFSYFRLFPFHIKKIKKQKGKKVNLLIVLFLVGIWTISGVLLTFQNYFLPNVVYVSLIIHDLSTWVGIPIILFHMVTRTRFVLKQGNRPLFPSIKEQSTGEVTGIPLSRRSFFKYSIGTILVFVIGPHFYKWLKQLLDDGGMAFNEIVEKSKGNSMNPLPSPAPESLPPVGGGLKGNFRAYTVTEIPTYTEKTWSFQIDGLVDKPINLSWEEFLKVKRTVQVSDFHCVTGWSVFNVTYEGILLRDLLEMVGVKSKATYVKFYSGDGVYTDALSLMQARMDDVMVAVLMDGQLIPADYGGPVRLIVPKMYAYKAVKWLVRIELIDYPHIGYWQLRGYDTDAWIKGK